MGPRRPCTCKKARTNAGDRITALLLGLRPRIAFLLHYWQVIQLSQAWRHILALTDARDIRIRAPYLKDHVRDAWTLDLAPAARELEVIARHHLAPAIAGPGAAALRKLNPERMVIRREWLHLPSLRFFVVPAAGGILDIWCCKIEHARVDIRLPFLRFMDLDELDISPDDRCEVPPFREITIDAPDYKSFTLRAPRLRFLFWRNQFAERVAIDVGRPGSVNDDLHARLKVLPIGSR
ncbi:hypothetical protein HU200_040913 [Digitaria exilis]|uniref:Uncharacterized protein n=1 Tax=Digitaria exilis TaxID=1010633 RepID=A0A835B8A9_9POAL|nr:hypothetical protein HU200_040913 [Digitaria exilis]